MELHCTYDPKTKGGSAPDGRKVKATLHWVYAQDAVQARVHLYDRLFSVPDPDSADNFLEAMNPLSLDVLSNCMLEPSLADVPAGTTVQFERLGYFCADPDTTNDRLVFNRTVPLRAVSYTHLTLPTSDLV